jgi:hypothetical protein
LSDDNRLPDEQSEHPQHWEHFLRHYGHAVYVAHLLEKDLANLLWFLDARKRNVIRRPTPDELEKMINEIDGNTIGELLNRLAEYQLEHEAMQLFRAANANRNVLVHHFTTRYPDETDEDSDFGDAARRVRTLAAPMRAAKEKAEQLASAQLAWMQAQIKAEAISRSGQMASPTNEQCEGADESLGMSAYVVADKAHCLFQPERDSAVSVIPPYGTEVDVLRDEGPWVLISFCGKEAWSPRANLSADLAPRRPAVEVGVVPPPNYEFRSPTQSLGSPMPKVEYGPRGGMFVRTPSGFRRYF